ncbi:putative F-box protein At1g53550 [Papaver somniferum]|uniref:putative F-box protein At1g53550 n=1 Tax=Papaver somniferum TaxID=3469 RepID=UPI000E6F74A1|nr:putative F-box protein At1g53550 [Papaver somniferum]XP_026413712.1 putative F-box protein At1g53550 [Papaver somniferum]XP_026413713.1 putative F-box protein At1g53550 [Papaver somniferum]
MEYFKSLPVEIALEILTGLPIESVLGCKLVSKTWRNLVLHPSFSKMHFHHHLLNPDSDSGKLSFLAMTRSEIGNNENFQYFEYNQDNESTPIESIRRINLISPFIDTRIVGSCNGLICLASGGTSLKVRPHCICNPITKEYVLLPEIRINCNISQYIVSMSGFGYVSSTNEYKVVGMFMLKKTHLLEVHIYTLGSGFGWRNIGNFDCHINNCSWQHRQGIFANGALCWLKLKNDISEIIAFDLSQEIFCENLLTPPSPPESYSLGNRIGVLDGVFFFAICSVIQGVVSYDVWLLKKKNGNHDMKDQGEEHQSFIWSREFEIYDIELLAITKSDGVLCLWDNYLNFYDLKAATSKWLVDLKKLVVQVLPHKNTLVSLKELGEEGTKTMESIEAMISH